jgi:hypothetical protein
MNEEQATSTPFNQTFFEISMNLARMAQCMYQHRDGHGTGDCETEDRVLSLLANFFSNTFLLKVDLEFGPMNFKIGPH